MYNFNRMTDYILLALCCDQFIHNPVAIDQFTKKLNQQYLQKRRMIFFSDLGLIELLFHFEAFNMKHWLLIPTHPQNQTITSTNYVNIS